MLELRNITKSYGDRRVLTDVSFTIRDGLMTGFVGGNGAGKTTTMRIVLGLLSRDGGEVYLDGAPLTDAARRSFGYMPEERGLYPKMRVAEQISYFARLHGLSARDAKRNTDELLGELGLTERAGDTVESLSLGNQQRAQIATALVHDPSVLILDEPFSGLDPIAVDTVVGVLKERAQRGVPVLFSSHQLDIVERLCDELVIIGDGAVRAAGTADDLRANHAEPLWTLRASADIAWVRDVPGIAVTAFAGDEVTFRADTDAAAQEVLRTALSQGPVGAFAPVRPSLTQIFREVVR